MRNSLVGWAVLVGCVLCVSARALGQCGAPIMNRLGGETSAFGFVSSSMVLIGEGVNIRLVSISNLSAPAYNTGQFAHVAVGFPVKKFSMASGGTRAYALLEDGSIVVLNISGSFLSIAGTHYGEFIDILQSGTRVLALYNQNTIANEGYPTYVKLLDLDANGVSIEVSRVSPIASDYEFKRLTRIGNTVWVGWEEHNSSIYGVSAFDFTTNPANPAYITTGLNFTALGVNTKLDGIAAVGNKLVLAFLNGSGDPSTYTDWIRVVDATNPQQLVWNTAFPTSGLVSAMSVNGTQVHIARHTAGMAIWETSNPGALAIVGAYSPQVGVVDDVFASPSGVDFLAARQGGMMVITTTTPSAPVFRSSLAAIPSTPTMVRQAGSITVVYDSTWGQLRSFNYALASSQQFLGAVAVGGGATAMEVVTQAGGSYACIGQGTAVYIYSLPTGAPVLVGTASLAGHAPQFISATNTRLYVYDTSRTLRVFDISNPAAPVQRSTITYTAATSPILCIGSWGTSFAIGTTSDGLWLYDASNALTPLYRGTVSVTNMQPKEIRDVVMGPTYLYVLQTYTTAGSDGFLSAVDVSNLSAPSRISTISATGTHLTYVQNAANSFLVVAETHERYTFYPEIKAYDLSIPTAPVQVAGVVLSEPTDRAVVWSSGNRLLAPSGDAGLYDIAVPTQWAPVFRGSPADASACWGQTAVLSLPLPAVSASPTDVTLQWYRNGQPLSDGPTGWGSSINGSHSVFLTITAARHEDSTEWDGGYDTGYRCEATNSCGTGSWVAASVRIGCRADFDCSGTLAVADIFAFLNAWFAGDPRANFDDINGLQVVDVFAFLNAWFAGCS